MKLAIVALLLAAPLALGQPQEPNPPRSTVKMITPVRVVPDGVDKPGPRDVPALPQPRAQQCRVIMIPSNEEVQNNPLDNGPLAWNVTWNVGGTARSVIQYAMDEWSGIIFNTTDRIANPFPITVGFSDFGASSTLLALTSVTYNVASGNLLSATMNFNTRYAFFIDTTPWDDFEFTCTSCTPVTDYDLLTVARHELGHAVGFTQTARINPLLVGSSFDPVRLNIGYDTATGVGFHTSGTAHPNDLMNSSIGQGIRRPISLYPSAALVARAFEYDIPLRFVDPAAGGSGLTGTANQPFNTASQALASPNVLFSPVTHHVPLNFFVSPSGLRMWSAARGGSLITAP